VLQQVLFSIKLLLEFFILLFALVIRKLYIDYCLYLSLSDYNVCASIQKYGPNHCIINIVIMDLVCPSLSQFSTSCIVTGVDQRLPVANTLDSRVRTCSTPMCNPSWGRPYQYHRCDQRICCLQFLLHNFMPNGHHMVT